MAKYKLFSAVGRCQPCRVLMMNLDSQIPNWKEFIDYLDADNLSEEGIQLANKLGIMSLPSFTDDEKIIFKGYSTANFSKLKELCIKE